MTRLFRPLLALLLAGSIGCRKSESESTAPVAETAPEHQHGQGEAHGEKHFEHRFKDADQWAARFDDPARDAWQKPAEVVTALGIAEGMVVADIGAGTGYFLPHFSRAVGESGKVIGLDIEPDMVRYMRERASKEGLSNTTAEVVPADGPGLAASSTDRIVIVNTWHHIPKRIDYTRKLGAALRPGGLVAIVDYTREAPRGPPAKHRLTADEVVAELTAGGLKARVLQESLPHQYIVVGEL